jgi:hypothetical protein
VIGGYNNQLVYVYTRSNGVWDMNSPHRLMSNYDGGEFGFAIDVFDDCIAVRTNQIS